MRRIELAPHTARVEVYRGPQARLAVVEDKLLVGIEPRRRELSAGLTRHAVRERRYTPPLYPHGLKRLLGRAVR
jgi:hypothetical protein